MKTFHQYRKDPETRNKYAEVSISAEDFIYPYFVIDGNEKQEEISSLTGVYRFSIDKLLLDLPKTIEAGIQKILLFGVVSETEKDEAGTAAYALNNLIVRAIRAIKDKFPKIIIVTDVCLCAYTSHGHCGVLQGDVINNDATLPLLASMALTHARAGADIVAPSAMMDGQVQAIRLLLDKEGFVTTKILAYSAKFASSFYGPFREAAKSAPSFGDRKTYQMDYRTKLQPIDEIAVDLDESADFVMIKPAHTYLDIIHAAKRKFPGAQVVAYQVSGEYQMIHLAAKAGLLNLHAGMTETLFAIKRAGADFIITYYARNYLQNQ